MRSKKMIVTRIPAAGLSSFSEDFPPLLKRIYLNRGITAESEINTALSELLPFHSLLHIEKAAALLAEGIKTQKRFLIIGDFDTDGATSTALGVSALKALGAREVDYLIPNRFEFGYGLTPEIVDIAQVKNPDILITVDNGIASHEGVLQAKKYGIQVVITDHHLPPPTLPQADVIINPNQAGDAFPSKAMAGVGVIFYVMLALRHHLQARHIPMAPFLDLVSVGTVADVVPLDKNNRILVLQGLKRIQQGKARSGIEALFETSRRDSRKASTADLGFSIAPRLNAAGRLEDMSLGVACLLSDTLQEARPMAQALENLNQERRGIESHMLEAAENLLKNIPSIETENIPAGFCLYHPDFHPGVIGILAGRLKDRYHRPTIVFASAQADELKGSARSIPFVHLRDLLALMDIRHPRLILKFGGHAMAAGLSIQRENLNKFSQIFHETLEEFLDETHLKNNLMTDGQLMQEEFSIEMAELLRHHSPWGQGFPEPLFEGIFHIVSQHCIQEKHLKLVLMPQQRNIQLEAIAFHQATLIEQKEIKIAYKLDSHEYQGIKKLQLIISHIET